MECYSGWPDRSFSAACACNLVFSISGAFTVEGLYVWLNIAAFSGALSFAVSVVLGLLIVSDRNAAQRAWVKAALVFLVLGPVAFWLLQWPAAVDTVCLGRCYGDAYFASRLRAAADVLQTHAAMVAVAAAAVFCAAIVTTEPMKELAA